MVMRRGLVALESVVLIGVLSMWPSATSGGVGMSAPVSASRTTLAAIPAGCKAYASSGSGASQFAVCVTSDGNLDQFVVGGQDEAFSEGYVVCYDDGQVSAYDAATLGESGFLPPTISQPTAGQFPVTITRDTSDGRFQLKQVWAKPDKTEDDVTVTMTLTNGTGGTLSNIDLKRVGDFDANGQENNNVGGYSNDAAFLWIPTPSGFSAAGYGFMEQALTFGVPHLAFVETETEYRNAFDRGCGVFSPGNPAPAGLLAAEVRYKFPSIASGASKTVKIRFARL